MGQNWSYSKRLFPSAPVITLGLAGLTFECVVDTGFSGGVMIPFPIFESLGLTSALVPDEYHAVMPDSRRVPVFTAKEAVTAGSSRMVTLVHASPKLDRMLVGRTFLGSFITTLDGPREMLSLSEQTPA